MVLAVEDESSPALPEGFELHQNAPNPFNPQTTIAFSLPEGGQVTVEIFNAAGQIVATLVDNFLVAGNHAVVWDANGFAGGIYLCRVKVDGYVIGTRKMLLTK